MLQRHPLLLAEWLALRNLVTRVRAHATKVVAAALATLGAFAVLLLTLRSQFPSSIAALLTYRVLTMIVIGGYAFSVVGKQRRRAEVRYTQFWLAAAPVRQYSRVLAILVVSLLPLAAQLLGVCVLLAVMGVAGGVDAAPVGALMLWITVATVLGAAVGWWSARRSRADAMEGSRYVRQPKARTNTVPSVAALSDWPVAQVRAWGRPENLRVLLMIAMLAVQAGSSALVGLSVVAMWLLGGYLAGLLAAVLQTANQASRWLRSTPLPFAQFAWAVSRRALAYQVVLTALAVGLMVILGAPVLSALYIGVLWLTIVLLACAIGLAESYRGRPPLIRLALSFAAVAVVETREHGWSIPLAAALAAWHLRAGAKT
jgi:hypothetical protein